MIWRHLFHSTRPKKFKTTLDFILSFGLVEETGFSSSKVARLNGLAENMETGLIS